MNQVADAVICAIKSSFLCRMSIISSMRSVLSVQNEILYIVIISNINSVQFFIIYVPSQQPQGQS
jgi:hypothetical protein